MDNQKTQIIKGVLAAVGLFFLYRSIQKNIGSGIDNNNANDNNSTYTVFNPATDGPGVWFDDGDRLKEPTFNVQQL